MKMTTLLPFITTIVTFIFVFLVFQRYTRRRGIYLLIWGIGLVLYGIGTFAEAFSTQAWNPTVFRLWYICGAMLTAAWLGQGTIYLLVRRRLGAFRLADILGGLLLVFSLGAVVVMFATPLNAAAFHTTRALSDQYREIMQSSTPRVLTPLFNIYGTIGLVGGAIYSSYIFWRKRVLPNRVLGNVFIALGGLSPALGGTLSRLGTTEYLYLSELIGAVIMFAGFILATSQASVPQTTGTELPQTM